MSLLVRASVMLFYLLSLRAWSPCAGYRHVICGSGWYHLRHRDAEDSTHLTPGTRLGSYEIDSPIGAGGMGEVYKATDTNLKRSVAIKVLPASVAGDTERLGRFQREAEVLAALNHPNIAAIYRLERSEGTTAPVMELVQGEDLSAVIARGPVPPDPVESLDGSPQVVSFPAPSVSAGQPPVTTGCTPVSGAAFAVGTTTVTCTTTDAKVRTASCTFPVVVQPPPTLSVTSFLAFGDSVTWGEDGRDSASSVSSGQHVFVQFPPGQRYPDILQQELQARYRQQTVTVTNAGCPGEALSVPGVFDEEHNCLGIRMDDPSALRRLTSALSLHQFDAVLLMEGSNDANSLAGDSTVLGTARNALQSMIEAATPSGIRVIVATIPPMVPPGFQGRANGYAVVPMFDGMIRGVASSEQVPLSDVYQAFGSDAPTLIGFDGLHPNVAGYTRIADTFFATIKGSLETPATTSRATRVRRPRS